MSEIAAQSPARSESVVDAQSQGLPRHISPFTAIAFAVACIGLATSGMLPYSSFLGIWPGTNLVIVLAIGMILSLIHGYTFSMMGVIAPYSGADYMVASRVLGGPIGFTASWGMMIVGAMLAGTALAFVSDSLVPSIMRTIAMLVGANGMFAVADTLVKPETVVLVGSVISVIVFGIGILPPKYTGTISKVAFVGGIAAWIAMLVQLAAPSLNFQAGWDRLMGIQSYSERFTLATNLGMEIQPQENWLVYGGLLIGFSLFFGNWINTYCAGEVKKPEQTLLAGSWVGTLITGSLFLAGAYLIQKLVPLNWLAAESYLNQSEGFAGLTMPWIYFYATAVSPSLIASVLVFFAFALLIINLVQMQFMYASRIILAWVDDEMMPASVGLIHPNLKSPIIATLIVAVISLVSLLASGLMGATNNPLEYILLLAVFQIPPALAITVLPFTRPSWFEAAPRIARLKVGPMPLVTLTGLISFIYLLAVCIVPFIIPMGKGIGWDSAIILAGIVVSGLAWFFLYRANQRRSGVKVDEHFKSLSRE